MNQDQWFYACRCGYRFIEDLGRYGCPNCEGDKVARLRQVPPGSTLEQCLGYDPAGP